MTLPFVLYIVISLIGVCTVGLAIILLVRNIENANDEHTKKRRRKPKISRRIRRQIEEIIRSYDDQFESSQDDDDDVDYSDKQI